MTKKDTNDNSVTKSARTIELRVIIPWFIVGVMLSGGAGLVGGWFTHSNAMAAAAQQTSQQAKSIVTSLK